MIFQGIIFLVVALVIIGVLVLIPGEITQSRIEKRLKGLNQKHQGRMTVSWKEDVNTLCDEHFLRYRFYREEVARMRMAGYLEHWQTAAFFLVQVVSVLVGLFIALCVKEMDFQSVSSALKSLCVSLIIVAVFIAVPRLWLFLQTSENMRHLRKEMPIAVELMTICMDSGNGLEQTFEKVGKELMDISPQIALSLLNVRSEMLAYDRKWALEKLEKESFLAEEKELARSLLESLRYGTPLVDALRALAHRMREENMNRLEEVAGKASTKMTVPMIVFLLIPVIVIMMAEPTIQFIRNMQ